MIVLVGAGRRKTIVDGTGHDAGRARGSEFGGHRRTQHVHGRHDGRIDIVLDRIHIGRKEDTSATTTHLMDVVHDLWVPGVMSSEHGVLRLALRERVPVPVVVVPNVVVIEPGQGRSLVFRADPLVVPVRDPLRPVRVQRWNVEQNDVVQNFPDSLFVRRGQTVQQPRRGLRPAHLRRVDPVCDEYDRAPRRNELLKLLVAGHPARIREPHLDVVKLG